MERVRPGTWPRITCSSAARLHELPLSVEASILRLRFARPQEPVDTTPFASYVIMPYNIWADGVKLVATVTIVIMVTALIVRWRQPLEAPKPKPKRLTFRVDNIPINGSNELDHNIRCIAEQEPDLQRAVSTMAQHSLTPRDKHSLCATVSITTVLSGEDLCTRLHRAGNCYPYSYTCRFDGITPLYDDRNGADVEYVPFPPVLVVLTDSSQHHCSPRPRKPPTWFLEIHKQR